MAGIEELRAKAIASMKAGGSSQTKLQGTSNQLGREGGVPSNENTPSCSDAPSTFDTSVKTMNPVSRNRQKKKLRSGNFPQWNLSPSLMASTSQKNTLRNHNKGQLQNKSSSPTWRGHSGSNGDLIISFSDDGDTDSELEGSHSQRKVNVKGNKEKVDRSGKLLQTSNLKERILQSGLNSQQKIVSRKTLVSRPSGQSFTRAHGSSNSIAVENRAPFHRDNSTVKIIPHKEIGQVSNINTTEDKLRSLREQIALRENVLRLQKTSLPLFEDLQLEANVQMQCSLGELSTSKENKQLDVNEQTLETFCSPGIEDAIGQQLSDDPTLEKTTDVNEQNGVASHQLQVKENDSSVMNLNIPNQLEPPEQNILDREGILHLEELYDNELEEALDYRRKCESEEMQALRAYRKAREALLAANNRCSSLYRKREMLSLLASQWPDSGENFSNASSGPLPEVNCLMASVRQDLDQTVQGKNAVVVGEKTAIDIDSRRTSIQHLQDFDLEASLRKKLISKSIMRSSLKCTAESYDTNGMTVNQTEMDGGDEKCTAPMSAMPSVPSEIVQGSRDIIGGSEVPGRNCSQAIETYIHPEDGDSYVKVNHSPTQVTVLSLPSCLWIVGYHLKLFPAKLSISHKGPADFRSKHNMDFHNIACLPDPFWPICIFELRGKCNDDECPWQHLKSQNRQKTKPDVSDNLSPDNQVIPCGKVIPYGFLHRLLHYTVSIPIYHVGSYLIEADMLLYQSVLAFSTQQYWDIGFCASPLLPLSIQRNLPSYIPFSCGGDVHHSSVDDWNRPSPYFSWEADRTKKMKQGVNDPERTLEIALDLVNGRMNNKALKKEVLSLLSRALEADPKSIILWIVYLHIYYRKEKSVGKDDMFSYAVKFNQNSYELWHLYIGSRMHFEERIVAYNEALFAFCKLVRSHPAKESNHLSSCILDLSLQMIHSLCMHGDVDKAIAHVNELVHPAATLKNPESTHLSDTLSCLISSDRCILWICCIYLVIYERLPEGVIQLFEFEKDLSFLIEWPASQISTEKRSKVLELLEKAVTAEKSTHFLAVNHIRCLAVIYGSLDGCCSGLLTEYMRMHPTCIDLLLIYFHLEGSRLTFSIDRDFFKEALDKWPKATPGSQRLWNQCAAFCLGHGMFEVAERLMERWFDCFCQNQATKTGLTSTLDSLLSNKQDMAFGLLNLGLYKLMQRNKEEAHWAIDRALDLSTEEAYIHCVREHALISSLSLSSTETLNLLRGYLFDSRSYSLGEPLTRRALTVLKKSKLRHKVVNFLGPVSTDFSLLNSVLETLYGPFLLPETFDEAKDMVDFVEHLMELTPSNHRLAMSTCESLSRDGRYEGFASKSVMFWAGTLLVNAVFQCSPAASESIWLRAVNTLSQFQSQSLSESFHKRAVSVHPFSLKLWQSYFRFSEENGNGASVKESARKRGFELI